MNKPKIENRLDLDNGDAFRAPSEYSMPELKESTFFDIFSEIHTLPEDMKTVKRLPRLRDNRMGRAEDARHIREYFRKALASLGIDTTHSR